MPTYDYHCDACQHAFEEWQSFKDDPLTKCPNCGSTDLQPLDKTAPQRVQVEFAEKVKKMNQTRAGSEKNRRP